MHAVVAIGGDGTINEIARSLVHKNCIGHHSVWFGKRTFTIGVYLLILIIRYLIREVLKLMDSLKGFFKANAVSRK